MIAIDQTQNSVGYELYTAWFQEGEQISLPYWNPCKLTNGCARDRPRHASITACEWTLGIGTTSVTTSSG